MKQDQMINQNTSSKLIYMECTINLINQYNPNEIAKLMKSGKPKTTDKDVPYLLIKT